MSSTVVSSIEKITRGNQISDDDLLAVEEPLEIILSFLSGAKKIDKNLSVTMRTPGNDLELTLGFLFTEGIIKNYDQVKSANNLTENIVCVELKEDVTFEIRKLEKHFYTSSSCGVCGKSSIDAINTISSSASHSSFQINSSLLYRLPELLKNSQNVFEKTGGLHASALFNKVGELILLREDVGRHNALDKIIGAALQNNLLPLENYILLLSGRASFELIQKATMAGIKIVAAIGAPSSLAVKLANERLMTLIGFLRDDRFNIYCGTENIITESRILI
jgi:FdhD protein